MTDKNVRPKVIIESCGDQGWIVVSFFPICGVKYAPEDEAGIELYFARWEPMINFLQECFGVESLHRRYRGFP